MILFLLNVLYTVVRKVFRSVHRKDATISSSFSDQENVYISFYRTKHIQKQHCVCVFGYILPVCALESDPLFSLLHH